MKAKYLCIIFLMQFTAFYAQQQCNETIINETIDYITSNLNNDFDISILNEDLSFLIQNKIKINKANEEDLASLYFLTEFQKRSILTYLKDNGIIKSKFELQYVYGFDVQLARLTSYFINFTVNDIVDEQKSLNDNEKGNYEIIFRTNKCIEPQKGYTPSSDPLINTKPNSYFLGNPYKFYSRFKYNLQNKLYIGFTCENDAGEPFFNGINSKGFDFYSGYFQFNNSNGKNNINIGDYHVNFGQGIAIWTGFALNKPQNLSGVVKNFTPIKYYSSVNENRFLRGVATTYKLKDINISTFLSIKKLDGNFVLSDTLKQDQIEISSIQNSGIHNTYNLSIDKHAIKEKIAGTMIKFSKEKFKVEAILFNQKFNGKITHSDVAYSKFGQLKNSNTYTGISYQYFNKQLMFFGETIHQFHKGMAIIDGIILKMSPNTEFSIIYRKYSKDYYSMYSNAFGENNKNQNEQGICYGINFIPFNKAQITTYYDFYKFNWLKYQADSPTYGNDFSININYFFSDYLQTSLKLKSETKQKNNSTSTLAINNKIELSDEKISHVKFILKYKPAENLNLVSRIDYLSYQKSNLKETGITIYQDLNYKPKRIPLNGFIRLSIFDTDSYSSRIYNYENDVLYTYSIIPYYYKGFRTYYALRYNINKNLKFWLKFSRTKYRDIKEIGTGLNNIEGNTKSDIKIQLQYKF